MGGEENVGDAREKPAPLKSRLVSGITWMEDGLLTVTFPERAVNEKLVPPVAFFSIEGPIEILPEVFPQVFSIMVII